MDARRATLPNPAVLPRGSRRAAVRLDCPQPPVVVAREEEEHVGAPASGNKVLDVQIGRPSFTRPKPSKQATSDAARPSRALARAASVELPAVEDYWHDSSSTLPLRPTVVKKIRRRRCGAHRCGATGRAAGTTEGRLGMSSCRRTAAGDAGREWCASRPPGDRCRCLRRSGPVRRSTITSTFGLSL